MAVIARAQVTLAVAVDVAAVVPHYLLQASTATPPSKPTAKNPSGWSTTEPAYQEGSTNTLYQCERTDLTDGTYAWSSVSVSSSYEAAKQAYNKAVAAGNVASQLATLVRQYGQGVLVCKTGQTVGALVNADGSFDVVAVTWDGDVPTAGTVVGCLDGDSVRLMQGLMRLAATVGTLMIPGGLTPQYEQPCITLGYSDGDPALVIFGAGDAQVEGRLVVQGHAWLNEGVTMCDGGASVTATRTGSGKVSATFGSTGEVALRGGDGSGWLVSDTGTVSGLAATLRVEDVDGRALRFQPDVLFDNPSQPYSGAVTLSASAANYNHMRIYFRTNDSEHSSVDVYSPNGKRVVLSVNHFLDGSGTAMWCKTKTVRISGTSINTWNNGGYATGEAQFGGSVNRGDYIAIVRVEAWNE